MLYGFKQIILRFKTVIYNSDSKITYNFCMYGGNTQPLGGGGFNPPLPISHFYGISEFCYIIDALKIYIIESDIFFLKESVATECKLFIIIIN